MTLSSEGIGCEDTRRRLDGLVFSESIVLCTSAQLQLQESPQRMLVAAALKSGSIVLLEVCNAVKSSSAACWKSEHSFLHSASGSPAGGEHVPNSPSLAGPNRSSPMSRGSARQRHVAPVVECFDAELHFADDA